MDELLTTHQEHAGDMLGTIRHLGDGDVPQDTCALVGYSAGLEKSWLEGLVNGDFTLDDGGLLTAAPPK